MTLNSDDIIWSVEDVLTTTLQTNVCVVVIYLLNKTGKCDMKQGGI